MRRERRVSQSPPSERWLSALGRGKEGEGGPYQCVRMELSRRLQCGRLQCVALCVFRESHAPDGIPVILAGAANGRRAPVYSDLVGCSGKPDSARIVELLRSVVLASRFPWSRVGFKRVCCSCCPVGGGGGGDPNVKERVLCEGRGKEQVKRNGAAKAREKEVKRGSRLYESEN